jgi:hypothetical protein
MDALAKIAKLYEPSPVVQGAWFKDQTVNIDGYVFERCRFDRCKLITEHATFVFRQCYLSADCSIYFNGPALKIARLLLHLLREQGRVQVGADEHGVFATLNHDGTFTLE